MQFDEHIFQMGGKKPPTSYRMVEWELFRGPNPSSNALVSARENSRPYGILEGIMVVNDPC